jgi:hypothetical protein
VHHPNRLRVGIPRCRTRSRSRPCRRPWIAASRRGTAALLALVLALSPVTAGAQQAEAVRAAFVLNFLKFAEWPAGAKADSTALVIAALGDDAQAAALRAGLDGKEIQGRRVSVRVFSDADQWRREGQACQALYITPAATAAWQGLRDEVTALPVLTISEVPGFCEQGGILNLYEEDHRIRFQANPGAADHAGLKLRSTLLTLATIVKTKGEK